MYGSVKYVEARVRVEGKKKIRTLSEHAEMQVGRSFVRSFVRSTLISISSRHVLGLGEGWSELGGQFGAAADAVTVLLILYETVSPDG